jgi:hypothetical protein
MTNNTKNAFSRIGIFTISILFLMTLGSGAHAADMKVKGYFGWLGVGTAVEVEKGHFYWTGEFSGTFFNDKGAGSPLHLAGVKCPAWFDSNFNTAKTKAGGYCVITDLSGDQATITWRNAGGTNPGDRGPGTFEYVSGTGKYEGISGSSDFVGIPQINWPDGKISGYSTWGR